MQPESEVGDDRLQICLSRLNQTVVCKVYIYADFQKCTFFGKGLKTEDVFVAKCLRSGVWKMRVNYPGK